MSEWDDQVDGFPLRDEVEDCAGQVRVFTITCHDLIAGYLVRAVEETDEPTGYEFGAYSETTPGPALYSVRRSMGRELSVRYLAGPPGERHLRHESMRGRITWSAETGVELVVDGQPLDMENLEQILGTHEGWGFELKILEKGE
jgi:hypothetical protein